MNIAGGLLDRTALPVPAPRFGAAPHADRAPRAGLLASLAWHAVRRPDACAFAFPLDAPAHRALSWAELLTAVHRHGARIAAAGGQPGDTVMVLSASVAEQVLGFLGAIAAGCVPTIVSYPSSKQSAASFHAMLQPVLAHSRARLLLHGADFAAHVGALAGATTLLPFPADGEALPPPIAAVPRHADRPLFLQFSSGTTGARKAVAVTEAMLLDQSAAYARAIDLQADDTVVSWLPLYHDMGLVAAFLIPMLQGATGVHVSPFDWLARPEMLFELVERHRASLLWLPNFAYALCAARIPARDGASLVTLRGIVNCSEPVREAAHRRFLDAFGRLGVREEMLQTCYAMAETTFALTQSTFGRPAATDRVDREQLLTRGRALPVPASSAPESTLVLVSSGRAIAGTELRIAGARGEREVGEIEARSGSMFGGYLFNADGDDPFTADGWLRTGDLGYLADGELFVTGRAKDLIIRRGHNLYPTDIEEAVAPVEGCKGGRVVAFGVDDPALGTQSVVVMVERAGAEVDAAALRTAVRERLLAVLNETVDDVVVCEPNTLRKSTSGKLSRSGNRQHYLERRATDSTVTAAAATSASGDPLERELQHLWCAVLRRPDLPLDARLFAELGADSLAAMQVVGEIRRRFGRAVDAGALLREDTVRRQARLLRSNAPAADGVRVCLQEGGERTPLFLVHAASGRAWPYRTLLPHLDADRPVHAFQAPELFGSAQFLDVEAMAQRYLDELLAVQPRGPYLVAGWSFGGAIAHALACRLAGRGEAVERLVLFDTDPPAIESGPVSLPGASPCARFLAALQPDTATAPQLAALMPLAFPERFAQVDASQPFDALWLMLRDALASACRPEETRPFLIEGQDPPTQLLNARVLAKNRRLAARYCPRDRFAGAIDVIAAGDPQRLRAWERHATGPVRVHAYPVAGTEALAPHFCMFEAHNVALFGADLNALLNGRRSA